MIVVSIAQRSTIPNVGMRIGPLRTTPSVPRRASRNRDNSPRPLRPSLSSAPFLGAKPFEISPFAQDALDEADIAPRISSNVQYVSTRGQAPALGFLDATLAGLARDGGLYTPAAIPQVRPEAIRALAGLSYAKAAARLVAPFVGDDLTRNELDAMAEDAYRGFRHAAKAPLVQIDDNLFLLELFHGPTLAFKDFAMQWLGRLMEQALARRGRRAVIVGATSGDTGAAAIEAFGGGERTDVFILFPDGRVSEVQRRQMATVDR